MTQYTGGYLIGSLATNSSNRALSKAALFRGAPPDLEFTEIVIRACRSTAPTTTSTIRPKARRSRTPSPPSTRCS
jgi:hypothetical protein